MDSIRFPYQYRTFDYLYTFEAQEKNTTLVTIYDLSQQILFKKAFSSNEVAMPPAGLSEEAASTLLTTLAQKHQIPEEYSPTFPLLDLDKNQDELQQLTAHLNEDDYKEEEDEPPSPSSASAASAPSPSSAPLDTPSLQMLQDLAQKSAALQAAADLADQRGVQIAASHPQSLQSLLASQQKKDKEVAELFLLQQKPKPFKYYQTFCQKMTGICIAAYSIQCGMVANAHQNKAGYIAKLFSSVGKVTPVIGGTLQILSGIFSLKNIRDNAQAIRCLTTFFADFEDSLQKIKTLARLLTQERQADIQSLPPPGILSRGMHLVQHWFTGDESYDPVVVLSVEDCEKLITTIITRGKVGPHHSEIGPATPLEEIAEHLLGCPLSPTKPLPIPSPSAAPVQAYASVSVSPANSVSASPVPLDPATRDELREMREKQEQEIQAIRQKFEAEQRDLQARLAAAEKAAHNASQDARAAKDVVTFVHGPFDIVPDDHGQVKVRLQDSANPSAAQGNSVVQHFQREIQQLHQRVHQVGVAAATLQEQANHTQARIEILADDHKGKKKETIKLPKPLVKPPTNAIPLPFSTGPSNSNS